jgi:hypothetical protein
MAAEYSIWLLPRAPEERALAALVASLAPCFCGMVFGPHVTVQGDLARAPEALLRDTQALAAQSAALDARVSGLERSPHFFRCLVLRLEAGAAFDALQMRAAHCNGRREGLSPFAHLSLAYGDASAQALPDAALAEIEREWLGQRLVLDRLAVVRSSKTVAIDEWRVLATFELRTDG